MFKSMLVTVAVCLVSAGASAQNQTREAGDWLIRTGATLIDPSSNNLKIPDVGTVDVDSSVSLTPSVTYMATGHLGIELLAAWPYSHGTSIPLGVFSPMLAWASIGRFSSTRTWSRC